MTLCLILNQPFEIWVFLYSLLSVSSLFPHLRVIGITGKIGSGKSTVTSLLAQKGFQVIDCDAIVHELYQPEGLGTRKIRTFFGETYLNRDSGVSRKKLLRTLLKSPKKWEILNRMIHPLVAESLRRKMRAFTPGWVALEIQIYVPFLFKPFIDHLWVVCADELKRIGRLKSRSLTTEQIETIGRQQKENYPDPFFILNNNGDPSALQSQVDSVLATLS